LKERNIAEIKKHKSQTFLSLHFFFLQFSQTAYPHNLHYLVGYFFAEILQQLQISSLFFLGLTGNIRLST
jgi:hypothetical protein